MCCFTDEKQCIITSPLRVTAFHTPGASSPPVYSFRGVCEHVFTKSCDGEQFSIVGDFISQDLSTGRVGLQVGSSSYIINEDLTVQTEDNQISITTSGNDEIEVYAGGVQVTTTRYQEILVKKCHPYLQFYLDSCVSS